MDGIALKTLREEMLNDSRLAADAFKKAEARFERGDEIGYESCAQQLSRLYNAFGQSGLRVAKAFENNLDDEQGWHGALLNRLAIGIPGIRPAFVPAELKLPLSELKGFRHVFVHAYDLQLEPGKTCLAVEICKTNGGSISRLDRKIHSRVATEQAIEL